MSFEQNTGQTAAKVQWLARGPESTLFLSGNDATVEVHHIEKVKRDGVELPQVHSAALRMSLLNAQPAQASVGEQAQPGKANYFTGKDAARWQKNVPLFGQVRLQEVYPGISLLYHGERGQLEYDFVVAADADPTRIELGFDGATPSMAANGDLLLPIPGETTVRFDKPVVYQMKDGARAAVDSSYLISKDGHVRFQLGRYDHSRELVIDPKLVFLGTIGTGNYPYAENVSQITVDGTGAMYFIGTTNDPTYPVTTGAFQTVCGPATGNNKANGGVYCGTYGATSAYISKISADGTTLVYSTYLSGGGGYEQGTSIAVDSSGVAYLLGATASDDFPITSDAFQKLCQPASVPVLGPPVAPPVAQCNNFSNGGGTEYTVNGPVFFYAKLSADGSSLLYSSFLGGSAAAYPIATALDASGNWYLFGQSAVLLPQNLYTGPNGSGDDVQFPGISSNGYLTYSGAIYGDQPSVPQNINVAAVMSKFSNDGKTLLYGTFFGDDVNGQNFNPSSLAVGANGVVFIGGNSAASAIPTTAGAVKGSCTVPSPTTFNGNTFTESCTTVDGFVAAFDTVKGSLVYSTRIGGSATSQGSNIGNQAVMGIAADASNDAYVTGYTYDQTFPVPQNGYLNSCAPVNPNNTNNCSSAYVLEVNPTGTAILGGSFLDGPPAYYESSVGYKVALDAKNKVYLYGTSQDGYNTFPLVNPVQGYSNNNELYVATMSSDLTQLLFSTRLGNPSLNGGNVTPVNGLALDANNNIYFAGSTYDASFAATPGTYSTATNTGTEAHTFFGKISPVLPVGVTTLSVSPGTTTTNQAVTFTVSVAAAANTAAPTGSVVLSYTTATNSTPTVFETLQLDSTGGATYTTMSLAAGTYTFTGAYSGDSNYDVSTSSAITLTINTPVAAKLALVSSASSVSAGSSVTFTATASGANGSPTGTVTFLNGTSTLGSAALSNGVASYKTSFANAGSFTITASYGGDTTYGTAVSSAVTEVVTLPAPTVTLTSSAATAVQGHTVTFTATLVGSGSAAPTGTVTFLDGTTMLGTGAVSNSTATYATSMLTAGTHSITASYSGDTNNAPAVSGAFTETVNAPAAAKVSLVSSASPVTVGTSVTFTATASGGSGTPTGTVTFLNGTTTLGTAALSSGGVATYKTSFATAGSYSITASYGGDATYGTAASSAVSEVVTLPAPTVTLTSSAAKASPGYSVTFTATVAGNGTAAPTGKVTFLDGTTTLGTGTISNGTATYSTSALATGSHSITAAYGGDSNYATAVSAAFTETIAAVSFTVAYNPSPVVIKQGSSGTTTMTITPSVPYTGTLSLGCNGTSLSITCSFNPGTLAWSANSATSALTSVITIQTTAPHASSKQAGFGAGTWLGSLAASFLLLLLGSKRRSIRAGRTLLLVLFLACTASLVGLSGCAVGGSGETGGTPTGTQSLSITFNGTDNGTPLTITVQ